MKRRGDTKGQQPINGIERMYSSCKKQTSGLQESEKLTAVGQEEKEWA